MSDHAGMMCRTADAHSALAGARRLNQAIREQGIAAEDRAFDAVHALQWRQMAIASEAVLTALDFYLNQGGGSRGARVVCDRLGDRVPMTREGPLEEFRFRSERAQDREEQIAVRFDGERFAVQVRPLRRMDRGERPFFERHWPDFLTGAIYQTGADPE